MSRRVLRAACIAALFVSAGPLPVTQAGSVPDFLADSAAATTRQPRATTEPAAPGGSTARQAHGSADASSRRSPAQPPGTAGAAHRQSLGSANATAPERLGSANATDRPATDSADATDRQGDSPIGAFATRNPRAGDAARQGPNAVDVAGTEPPDPEDATPRRTTGTTGARGATAAQGLGSVDGADSRAAGAADATGRQAAGTDGAPSGLGGAGDAALQGLGVGELLARLQGLYRDAEAAAEGYKATELALKAGQDEERRLSAELAEARTTLGAEKAAAGRVAREQYQGAVGFSPYARMLLTGDPQAAQDQRRLAAREGARRAGVLTRLTRSERRADLLATAARKSLDARQTLTAQRKRHKQEADLKLRQVERVLAALTPEQLARLGSREAANTATAQRELLDSGRLAATPRTPTAAGGAALTYATEQIGKPYVWGAEGPGSFDCSGLTSQAWARAGRSIPRTSQEQWAQLPKVPLDELRPGDLVVYFPTATHVALYVGDGKVIQAPRPGAKVKVSPIAANPLLGAVRPDPDAAPLAEFTAPALPDNDTDSGSGSDDSGYSSAEAPATSATSATSAK
ncbi:NlpC/P60 family protein [Streptomyces sp. NBC_01006]|uniref:NlpC/P60 family protein n=1 Tax=Streptomyces sp. NBC_01006 TaxID=2903716 RepID=UPI0038678A47|nr:NlpC/P60 family protein [Streptomyces sp. NBC_01006]